MSVIKRIKTEIWVNLPAWFIFYITAYTLFGYIGLLKNPRPDYAMTFVFPYGLFLVYYYSRFRADGSLDAGGRVGKYLLLAGITSAILVITVLGARPVRFGPDWASHVDRSIIFYEISNILWTLIIAAHCVVFQGWKKFLLFFGVAFVYGMILESSGVTMGFFSEDRYHLYLPGFSAPVATMFGWSMVFYPCMFIIDMLRRGVPFIENRSFLWLGLFVALAALCFDAIIDPYATDFGLWTWNGSYNRGNSFYWCGVPLVNFVSWFAAVVSFGAFYYFYEVRKTGWDQVKKAAVMLGSLPLILLAAGIIEFSTLGVIEGFNGPSWAILKKYISDGMPLFREPQKGKMPEH
jgi:uncharacterized membrane protein